MATVYDHLSHQEMVDIKRRNRMASVDALPAEVRVLVHEYGLNAVRALWDLGVRKPGQIRHVVETILDEFSPTRGSSSAQGGWDDQRRAR